MATGTPFVAVLTTNGNQTGEFNAIGNYSASPVDFYFKPQEDQTLYVHTLEVTIKDDNPLIESGYGSGLELVNGIYAHVGSDEDANIWKFPSEARIRRNWDWGQLAQLSGIGQSSAVKEVMHASLNFLERCGSPVTVSGKDGQHFGLTLNDDFTGLLHQQFVIFGSIGS